MCFTARFVSTVLLLNFSVLLSSPVARAEAGLLVGAAADLQPLQNQLVSAFSRMTGATPVFTFAASGSLAQQIRNGAPYDIYLSANETFVKQLSASGHLLPDTVRVYAFGRIALWSKNGRIRTLADLMAPGV